MGLGKTLTMISLVAMDMEKGIDMCPLFEDIPANNQDIGSTLVIVPPPSMTPLTRLSIGPLTFF